MAAPAAAPAPAEMDIAEETLAAPMPVVAAEAAPARRSFHFGGMAAAARPSEPQATTVGLALSPPAAWRAPTFAADLPAAQAGGYDLAFPSLRTETVRTGKGPRRVALFAESWPVAVERKLFPAIAPEAFLVAEIKNPSSRPLPGGSANLFVGADPAGVAHLKLVAPGEPFTLPLGLDRAIKPVRNVKLVTTEKGVFSKDEVNQYVVTIEVANPYRTAIPVRIEDQLPVTSDKNVEIKLTKTSPEAAVDAPKGALEWKLTVPPSGKAQVSFEYTLKRPKGWRLHQSQ
jgi:uncharacterized protein (TIGR02231 family)